MAALPLKLGLIDSVASFDNIRNASGVEIFGLFLVFTIYINVLLGVFNLIPIAPLDGFKVAVGLLPDQLSQELDKLSKWGPGILMSLFVLSWVAPQYNVLGWFLGRVSSVIFNVIV